MDLPTLDPLKPAVVSGFKGSASNVFQGKAAEFGPQQAFDSDPQTRWATDSGTKQGWIAADLGQPKMIENVRIQEAAGYTDRVTKFEFQYRDGGEWKTIFCGTQIGAKFQKRFEPVKAQEFRLNILDATEGPTIAEIELLGK